MSPQVFIDDDAFAALGALAKPFVETEPNDVIRRLVGLDDEASQAEMPTVTAKSGTPEFKQQVVERVVAKRQRSAKAAKGARTRAKKGSVLEEEAYFVPILRALSEQEDGRLAASEVIERVGDLVEDQLKPTDREMLETGTVRWKARTQFARMHMKEQGLIKPDSPRGIWEISDAGRQHLQAAGITNAG